MTEQYQCQSYSDDDRNVQDCTWGKCGNTPDTEWEEEFEHLSCSNLLREKDPIYGEENRRAKQQLKTFITTLLTSRDTYLKENFKQMIQKSRQIKISDNKDITDGWDMALLNLQSTFDHPDAITNEDNLK